MGLCGCRWEGGPGKSVCVGRGGGVLRSVGRMSYDVEGFPMVVVFWNKGAPVE